jgi:hypothetical protein
MDDFQRYRLKLDILFLAKEICNQQYYTRVADLDEIIKAANELYKFVRE